jgi:CBS domain containing-hemolysin-like protein
MYGEVKLAALLAPQLARIGNWAEPLSHGLAFVIAVGLLTFLHVVAGEMVPKAIALRFPERTAFGLAPLMRLSRTIVYPVVALLSRIGRLVLKVLRIPPAGEQGRILSVDELALLIGESADGGLIEQREHQIMLKIIEFSEREVHHIMTPRTRMQTVSADIGSDELEELLAASSFTRFPIYERDLDHIVGTLHLKDFIRWRLSSSEAFDLRSMARPARMVPEHMPTPQLLEKFRSERGHMAIVIDEYGGTAGLVTLEDVAEELVGEMLDEFDSEAPALTVVGPGILEVRGDMLVDELDDYVQFPSDIPDVDTVGGLLVTLLGRPAKEGDATSIGNVTLVAKKVRGLAVEVVRVE